MKSKLAEFVEWLKDNNWLKETFWDIAWLVTFLVIVAFVMCGCAGYIGPGSASSHFRYIGPGAK